MQQPLAGERGISKISYPSQAKVSVIIPTIKGREQWLKQVRASFEATPLAEVEIIEVHDRPTCGIAWNAGIREATGDYILLSADDVEPVASDWLEVGRSWVDQGYLPCARVLNTDGTLQSCGDVVEETETGTPCTFARIPFASVDQMKKIYPIIETHYATDYWFSHRGRQMGWETVVVREFCFFHHFAKQGRLDDRLNRDMKTFWRRAKLPGSPVPG